MFIFNTYFTHFTCSAMGILRRVTQTLISLRSHMLLHSVNLMCQHSSSVLHSDIDETMTVYTTGSLKKTCTRQLLNTQHALCMTNQWILLCSSACWGNVNLCVCGLCLLLLGHEIHVTEWHVSVVSIAGMNLGVGDNRDRYEPSLC